MPLEGVAAVVRVRARKRPVCPWLTDSSSEETMTERGVNFGLGVHKHIYRKHKNNVGKRELTNPATLGANAETSPTLSTTCGKKGGSSGYPSTYTTNVAQPAHHMWEKGDFTNPALQTYVTSEEMSLVST